MHSIIEAIGIKRTYGHGEQAVHALKNVNLTINKGSLVALKGRSGSGKTTFINLLGALDRPTEGDILFDGELLSKLNDSKRTKLRKEKMGFIFQSFALMPLMSAYENIEFALRIAGIPVDEHHTRTKHALERVGLQQRSHHRPYELSGGEQQRVAIARAMAHRPKLILADEPTAELDSRMGLHVLKLFRELVQHEDMSIILTTHDPAIMEIVDNVYSLEDGEIVENISTY